MVMINGDKLLPVFVSPVFVTIFYHHDSSPFRMISVDRRLMT